MAGLYQEGQRFPMYEEGKRFQTGSAPPLTMADYLRMLETRKRISAMPGEIPSGLEAATIPSPDGTIWRGKGLYGEQAFTNIPERAQAMGLRETMPPVPEGGYIETMPTGKTFAVEAPQAQVGGQGRSYAEKVKARQKLESHILENRIPMAEAIKLQEVWGVDNDSLEKAQKAEMGAAPKAPTSEFGIFAADYTQRKPGASMEEVVKAFHGARIPGTRPLPVTALTNLRNPETLEPLPYGTTAEEAQAMGAIRVSQKNVDTLKDLDNTDVLINQIDAITKRLMSTTSPVEAVSGGALKKVGAITRMAPLASAYNDQKSAFLGVISRTMGGERGVLTDRDISRIENSLPGFTDTRQLRDYKINTIKNLMEVAKQAARAKLVGGDVDTSAMRAQIDRHLDELEGIKTQPTGVDATAAGAGKTIVKTGTDKSTGRKVVQYSDGSVDYAPQ